MRTWSEVDQRLADAGQGPADEQRPDKDGSPARKRVGGAGLARPEQGGSTHAAANVANTLARNSSGSRGPGTAG